MPEEKYLRTVIPKPRTLHFNYMEMIKMHYDLHAIKLVIDGDYKPPKGEIEKWKQNSSQRLSEAAEMLIKIWDEREILIKELNTKHDLH